MNAQLGPANLRHRYKLKKRLFYSKVTDSSNFNAFASFDS